MSLLRLALYIVFSSQGHSFFSLLSCFGLGVRFDLRYAGILGVLILIGSSWPILDPFRRNAGRKWLFFLTSLAGLWVVFFYCVDFAYYAYLSQRLSASVLNYLTDTSISAGVVWQTYPVLRIVLILIAGTWAIRRIIRWTFGRIRDHDSTASYVPASSGAPLSRRARVVWFAATFLLLGLGIFGRIGQYPLRWSDAFAEGGDYQANLSLNPFQSFFSSLKFRHSTYDEAKVKAAYPILAPYFGWDSGYTRIIPGTPPPDHLSPGTRPNVIVVICESFSAYKSSMWGNPLNTTPFFDSLCREGLFFDHCFTPSYGTARGVWAVVTGIPDVSPATSTSSRNPAAVDQHTIINDFQGYDKFYFLGGSTSWANIRGLLTNNIRGLHLYEQQDYQAPKVDVWGISDKNLFLEATKVLRTRDHPFFAVIQTADNHRPYTIPKEDQAAFHSIHVSGDSLQRFGFTSDDEMNAFRYTDFGYRTFIEAASKEKFFSNTIFLFVGDHGIPGDAGNLFPRAWTTDRLTAEHVPLLIYAPGRKAGRRFPFDCSQLDVLPTLAGLCHIPYRNTTLGRDILDTVRNRGKEFAFIYDPDQAYIGLLKDGLFYRRGLITGNVEMASVTDNNPVSPQLMTGPVRQQLEQLTEGLYETARYMLLKNRK
ncbi:MAG TPA: sulfatase-like hydrolase/transferase [Puia sp.]|nr:sulfatase-like hydrolase/transferase [Puia sp.]